MKVAIIAHDRFPIAAPFAGGLESFTWHLARGLRERGVGVALFAGPGSDPMLQAEELAFRPLQLSDRARDDVAMPPEAQVRETVAYLQAMRTLAGREDVDLVHNNSLHHLPITMAHTLPQPVLTTLHSPPTPWLEPALELTPDALTAAVSGAVAAMWSHVTAARVIHNGVDLAQWTCGPGGRELVWSGRLVPEKAPHLAAAIAHRAGLPLRIAGPISDPGYVDRCLRPLLRDDVTYVGHLAPDELRDLVGSSAACLVTPAWDEPFGLVAAESMATGTPVLGLARGGLVEIVGPPGGIAVGVADSEAETVEAAVAALPQVLGLDRRAVRRHAEQHCSLRVTLDRYLELYEELTA